MANRVGRGLTAGLALVLAGCEPAVLDPAGPVGTAEKTILIDSMAIMLAIVVPTILAILGAAFWFRASNTRARRYPDWAFSGQIELVVWSIPLLTIMLLGGVIWIGSHDLDPYKPLASDRKTVEVQVVSMDWKWLFIYPDLHVASINELVVPAATPVHFTLTSATVMNSFFVPQLGSQIYTMGGMATQLNLIADAPGSYRGLATHFSGDGFSDMHFIMRAVAAPDFSAWVATARASGPALDEAKYRDLLRQGLEPPATFRDAGADLFQKIVSQQLPFGAGPTSGPEVKTAGVGDN